VSKLIALVVFVVRGWFCSVEYILPSDNLNAFYLDF